MYKAPYWMLYECYHLQQSAMLFMEMIIIPSTCSTFFYYFTSITMKWFFFSSYLFKIGLVHSVLILGLLVVLLSVGLPWMKVLFPWIYLFAQMIVLCNICFVMWIFVAVLNCFRWKVFYVSQHLYLTKWLNRCVGWIGYVLSTCNYLASHNWSPHVPHFTKLFVYIIKDIYCFF